MPIMLTALAAAGGPILKVLFIASVGFMAASDRIGLLKSTQLSSFSRMTTMIFLPPFLFIKLSTNVDMGRVFEWWTIPFFVAMNLLGGIVLGRALIYLLGHRMGENKGVVLAACAIGNVGQLPLALAQAACNDGLPKFIGRDGDCDEDAIAMVCFGLWVASITMWSLGGYLINFFDGPPAADAPQLAYAQMEEPASENSDGKTRKSGGQTRKSDGQTSESDGQTSTPCDAATDTDTNTNTDTASEATSGGPQAACGTGSTAIAGPGTSNLNEGPRSQPEPEGGRSESRALAARALAGASGPAGTRNLNVGAGAEEPEARGRGSGSDVGSTQHVAATSHASAQPEGLGGVGAGSRDALAEAGEEGEAVAEEKPGPGREWVRFKLAAVAERAGRTAAAINPPICAVVLGLLFGTIPSLKAIFVEEGAPLSLLKQAAQEIGEGAIPCMLMVLGANMRPRPGTENQGAAVGGLKDVGGWPVVFGVMVVRLVLLPVVGVLLVRGATVLDLLPSDPLVPFIILLQFSVPTAMNLQLVATIHGKGQSAATTLTVGQYAVAVPSLTLAMMYYLT